MTAGDEGGGARGGAGGGRSPSYGSGEGRLAGGGYRDGRGTTRGTEGAEQEKTEETETMATAAGRQRQTTVDPPECRKYDGSGGE